MTIIKVGAPGLDDGTIATPTRNKNKRITIILLLNV